MRNNNPAEWERVIQASNTEVLDDASYGSEEAGEA